MASGVLSAYLGGDVDGRNHVVLEKEREGSQNKKLLRRSDELKEPYGDVESHPEKAGDQQGEFHLPCIWKESFWTANTPQAMISMKSLYLFSVADARMLKDGRAQM